MRVCVCFCGCVGERERAFVLTCMIIINNHNRNFCTDSLVNTGKGRSLTFTGGCREVWETLVWTCLLSLWLPLPFPTLIWRVDWGEGRCASGHRTGTSWLGYYRSNYYITVSCYKYNSFLISLTQIASKLISKKWSFLIKSFWIENKQTQNNKIKKPQNNKFRHILHFRN